MLYIIKFGRGKMVNFEDAQETVDTIWIT